MAREGCVDFGDQIVLVLRLLRSRPYVLGAYQRRFKYVLVDEFQDTNHAQFELVKLLAARHGNVTVVGDEDQAIYRFRGAAISNILGFLDVYRDALQIVLTENYRSTQEILDAAYRLIVNNNPDRLEVRSGISKQLHAVRRPGPAPGHPLLRDRHPGGGRRCHDDPRQGRRRGVALRRRRHARAFQRRRRPVPPVPQSPRHPVDVLRQCRPLRAARDPASDLVPALGGPHGRVGEPALPGVVRPLPGSHRRSHALRDVRRAPAR